MFSFVAICKWLVSRLKAVIFRRALSATGEFCLLICWFTVSASGHSWVPGHYTEKEKKRRRMRTCKESFFFGSAYIALAKLCCKCEPSGKLMASHQIARMSEHSNRINHKIGCSSSSSANATGMYQYTLSFSLQFIWSASVCVSVAGYATSKA